MYGNGVVIGIEHDDFEQAPAESEPITSTRLPSWRTMPSGTVIAASDVLVGGFCHRALCAISPRQVPCQALSLRSARLPSLRSR